MADMELCRLNALSLFRIASVMNSDKPHTFMDCASHLFTPAEQLKWHNDVAEKQEELSALQTLDRFRAIQTRMKNG